MVIDNLKTQPNMVVAVLDELESRMSDQEMRSMAWKLADEEDGYKGDNDRYSVHNTSGGGWVGQSSPNKSTPAQPNAPHPHDPRHGVVKIHEESLPLYPGMPSEV